MNLDWLIVGGGIHGVHIAARLLVDASIDPDQLRIVDPGSGLLERWRRSTATTGMSYLRSPSVHHLGLGPWALQRFVRKDEREDADLFAAPNRRPALHLFNAHCDQVIAELGIGELHVQARATSCLVECDGVAVQLSTGEKLKVQNVVLAIGAAERVQWPNWAPASSPRIQHIFDKTFERWPASPEKVAVVGGGISAVQVALRLQDEGHDVHLISRHSMREHQFDSEPGWLGPRLMRGFAREKNFERRREIITDARHRGSVPPDVHSALLNAISAKKLAWHQGEVKRCDSEGDMLGLSLCSSESVSVDRVLLATGFAVERPGGSMVDALIESAELPCAGCGYPIIDSSLQWHPRVHVTGPLAELELGPASRNIAGAQRAGDRLIGAVLKRKSKKQPPALVDKDALLTDGRVEPEVGKGVGQATPVIAHTA